MTKRKSEYLQMMLVIIIFVLVIYFFELPKDRSFLILVAVITTHTLFFEISEFRKSKDD